MQRDSENDPEVKKKHKNSFKEERIIPSKCKNEEPKMRIYEPGGLVLPLQQMLMLMLMMRRQSNGWDEYSS